MTRDLPTFSNKFPIRIAACVACGLVLLACAISWTSLTWRQLQDRVDKAEASVARTQKELTERRQEDAERQQHDQDMQDVEASLRLEMEQLHHLVDQQEEVVNGMGIARDTIASAFSNLELVNKDDAARQSSEHFAIEGLAGSIQLRGTSEELRQIEFFGELKGEHGQASTAMLSTLLSTAIPQWESAHRELWLEKLMSIDDQVFVHRDFDRVRVTWHWTDLDGVRFDVLSIEPK